MTSEEWHVLVFSEVTFLFYFLPLALAFYAIATPATRNGVLLGISVVFYVWGSGWLVVVPLASVAVGYLLGFVAERAATSDDRRLGRLTITASVVVHLALLGWFKYAEWFLRTAVDAGLHTGTIPEIMIPIGISFFTFQSISHTIDVGRGRAEHLTNPIDFAVYVLFFPTVLAGPIVRYHEIDAQIRRRAVTLEGVGEGALRFGHGLAKKVIVADAVAPAADVVFATDPAALTTAEAWVGVVAFTVQIYFDFSGYADMAIGLGRMFGFRLPENFNRPYSALSISDFWGRWNVSLTRWFRDYLYAPLGASRTRFATMAQVNVFVAAFLAGLWYGASWTFVAWGIYHGVWLMIEARLRVGHLGAPSTSVAVLRRTRTLLAVIVGWALFRADSVPDAVDLLRVMFGANGFGIDLIRDTLFTRELIVLALASLVAFLPRSEGFGPSIARSSSSLAVAARVVVMFVLLPAALLLVASGAESPFLYLEF